MTRTSSIARRWTEVLVLGIVVAAAWQFFGPRYAEIASQLVPAQRIGLAATFLAFCFWVARGRWLAFLGLRHFAVYPPPWVSAFVAVHLLALKDVLNGASLKSSALPLLAGPTLILLSIAFSLVMRRSLFVTKPNAESAESTPAFDPLTFESLCDWIRNDDAIGDPQSDLFGHSDIATRIASRISSPANHRTPPTIAIVGDFGAGKSSVRRLVEHRLAPCPRPTLVTVNLWPLENADAAVQEILRQLIGALGRHFPTLALKSVPGEYLNAIEGISGSWSQIIRALQPSRSPAQVLNELEIITTATGQRFILWIEDLERFARDDPSRLSPIRALLHLLDDCQGIQIVVSDAMLDSGFDAEKLARFVERIPRCDYRHALSIVCTFRHHCLNGYPIPIIDPASDDGRNAFDITKGNADAILGRHAFDPAYLQPAEAFCYLLATPRIMKSALRWTLETWERIPGEIDIDHVLAASCLRVTRPDVFNYVLSNLSWFRNPRSLFQKDDDPKPIERVQRYVSEIEDDPIAAAAIEKLLTFLFPRVIDMNDSRTEISSPQALFVANDHSDYAARLLSAAEISSEASDQSVLRMIAQWQSGRDVALVSAIGTPLGNVIVSFAGQFRPSELCEFANEAYSVHGTNPPPNDSALEVVRRIHRMLRVNPPDSDLLYEALVDALKRTVRKNFAFTEDALSVLEPTAGSLILEPDRVAKLRASVHRELASVFTAENADQLPLAMDTKPYTLALLLWNRPSFNKRTGSIPPFPDWRIFSSALLKAASLDREKILPSIALLVAKVDDRQDVEREGTTGHRIVTKYDVTVYEELIPQLFDLDAFVDLFGRGPLVKIESEGMQVVLDELREFSVSRLGQDTL